jgi:hypothetical protein
MKKPYWYLIGGIAVLLLSIPAYRLYHASTDLVDTLPSEETDAENRPDTTPLPVMNSPTSTPYPEEFYEGKG